MDKKLLQRLLKKYPGPFIFLLEIPEEKYFEESVETIRALVAMGYAGVCLSFIRPCRNFLELLQASKVDTQNLQVVDVAAALAKQTAEKNNQCVHISEEVETSELVEAVYTSVAKLAAKNTFVFIDSIRIISLYKPLSEIMRFSDFLIRELKHAEIRGIIINVPKGLARERFLREIALHADEKISL